MVRQSITEVQAEIRRTLARAAILQILVYLFCSWFTIGISHSAETSEPAETQEEARWSEYFGPVTPAEREVFSDWRSERRKQYKEIEGSEAISIIEMQMSGNVGWYGRRMLELAERKRYEDSLRLTLPQPAKLEAVVAHTAEAKALIDAIKRTYGSLENVHMKVRIWPFARRPVPVVWENDYVIENELWFSRSNGTRSFLVDYREWGYEMTDDWVERGCNRRLERSGVWDHLGSAWLDESCGTARIPFVPKGLAVEAYQTASTAGLLLFGMKLIHLQTEMNYACKIRDGYWLLIICSHSGPKANGDTYVMQIDRTTQRIVAERRDTSSPVMIEYLSADADTVLAPIDLIFSIPAEAKSLFSKKAAKYLSEEDGSMANRSLIDVMAETSSHVSRLKEFVRECNVSEAGDLELESLASELEDMDHDSGKPWAKLFKECRLKTTPPIVFQKPPAFAPCPDWTKSCEEQLQ
ncbi:MAG: hypothetical protein IPO66_11695 [Rhodanobacteraceae bacterium]|nr:hypothetical protein [Rhodanobacteraceae bacterium]